jgi:hypothetical protein
MVSDHPSQQQTCAFRTLVVTGQGAYLYSLVTPPGTVVRPGLGAARGARRQGRTERGRAEAARSTERVRPGTRHKPSVPTGPGHPQVWCLPVPAPSGSARPHRRRAAGAPRHPTAMQHLRPGSVICFGSTCTVRSPSTPVFLVIRRHDGAARDPSAHHRTG